MIEQTNDGNFYVLTTRNKRTLSSDIAQYMNHLGPGLSSQIINIIERGTTQGQPNLKYSSENMTERVLINCAYVSEIEGPVDQAILDVLRRYVNTKGKHTLTYDESSYVFYSDVRASLTRPEAADVVKHEELDGIPASAIKISMLLFGKRVCTTGEQMWYTPQSVTTARISKNLSVNAEECTTIKDMYKVKRDEIGPLVVHKDIFKSKTTHVEGIYDKTMRQALLISGGYKAPGRVWVSPGAGPILDHYVEFTDNAETSVTISNPMYKPSGTYDVMFDEYNAEDIYDETHLTRDPADIVWDPKAPNVTFTHESNLEDKLIREKFAIDFGYDIPENWLPSKTNYM